MNITITEAAATEVRRLMDVEKLPTAGLRVAVQGGGCSGFQWKLTLDEHDPGARDTVIEQNGVRLYVDSRSALYADGTQIDFLNDLNQRGFKCSNPRVKATCGCGSSFTM